MKEIIPVRQSGEVVLYSKVQQGREKKGAQRSLAQHLTTALLVIPVLQGCSHTILNYILQVNHL